MDKENILAPFEIPELRDSFEANKTEIAAIFVKRGFSDLPVNQFGAGVAYLEDPGIAGELAPFIIPADYNYATGDEKKQNRQQLAGGILGFLGNAVALAGDIVGSKSAANAVNNASPAASTTTSNNNTTNNSAGKVADKKIFGMSYVQFGLAAGVVILMGVLLFIAARKKKVVTA